jgi:hypothetical protein
MNDELYKWNDIIDEGEYWSDISNGPNDDIKIRTIVTDGDEIYTYYTCPYGWSTMAKSGGFKYMNISI